LRVERAKNQMLRFAGGTEPGESFDTAEAREEVRLLAAIAAGNQHVLAVLYRRRGGLLYSLLVRMLLSEMEAQEVMQDTFVQIWRRAHEFDAGRSSPVAWMIMIARGLALDRLRARARRSASRSAYEREVASLAVEEMNGARQTERDELVAACAAALHGLPELQARALQLAFLRGWTHEEIACAEGEPLGTIKARIRRGLLALRRALKDYHG
jgi:RNA polymerase sigma-70 factor, ECF subfamily